MHIFLLKSGGEGQSLLPLVATTLCSILLISIRLSSFDLLHFGTNFRGYIRTCFPITGNPNNLFLFFNFYARIDQIIKEVFTTCDYIDSSRHSQGSFHFLQVNLCQELLFLHQLTHNMTTDCSLNYKFNT